MNRRTGRVGSLLGALALLAAAGCEGSADSSSAVERGTTSQAVVSGPDFVVSSVTGPASAQPGQQFTASVTLCNQGTQGASTNVEVYLSTDTTITPNGPTGPSPDSYVGYAPSPYLNPGQCQTLAVQGSAYVPTEGAYYLGAVADPQNSVVEVLENNNAKAGARMGIGNKPDFIVSAVTGPASAQPGQQLTASVTVCNQGTQGASTNVEVYLSADTTITPNGPTAPSPDSYVGNVSSPYLNPSQCQTLTLQGSPYVPTEGPYYLGAVVDPQSSVTELIEDNNAKTGTRMGIGSKPDFIVSAVTGPASALPSQQLTASVTVCNQGTQGGSAGVEVYLSADTTITPNGPTAPSPDSYVGYASAQYFNPGQCQTLAVQGPAYVPADGAYYLGAVVDPQSSVAELIEDNNTKAGTRMGIGSKPDFIVSAVTGPASAQPGQQFTASATVCNQGTQGGSTGVEVYLSADTTITPNGPTAPSPDSYVGYASAQYLNPGQCQTLAVQGSAYVPTEGAYYLGAVVDPQNGLAELIEDNNAKTGTRMGIGNKPDFIVSAVTGPASFVSSSPGQQFTTSVTLCNQGTQGGSTNVEVYLSADTTITPMGPTGPSPDFYVGNVSSPYLNPSQCQTLTLQGSASVPTEGPYYLGAVADPQSSVAELIEDNNTKAGTRMGIGSKPDFIVSAVTGPASALPGQQITASVTVCNQGTVGGSTGAEVYLSADTTITPNGPTAPSPDSYVGYASAQYFNPGQCQTLTVQGPAYVPADGAYYLGAVADPQSSVAELIEDNNAKAGTRMGIGSKPDFIVSAVTGPASALPGQQLTASVTVCNQGTQGGSTGVEVYLSADTTITPNGPTAPSPDSFVGYVSAQYLNPGQCQTLAVQGSAYVPTEGAYYLGAVADPQSSVAELLEDNNTRAGTRMGIGNKPDFIVSAVTGPASFVSSSPGQQFTTSVTVCNQGTVGGSTSVEVYLSADTTITPNGPMGPSPDFYVGNVYSQYLSAGLCQTLTLQGSPYVPTEGAYYLGAVADPLNDVGELIEDNNAKAGTRMGIGSKPDFIVSAVTGPASALPGQQITASVTVCNQGTVGGSVPVEVYLSADTTITPNGPTGPSPDSFVGYASSAYLNAGQCQTLTVQGPAYVPADGAYYLGAVVDPQSSVAELIEDNNTKANSRIGIGSKPDFIVSAVSSASTVKQGQSLTASVTVCNQGTQAGSTVVEVYLSADTTISPNSPMSPSPDTFLGYASTATLSAGQCQLLSVAGPAYVPNTGAYYVGAVADPQNGMVEFFDDNNAKAGTLVTVTL